MAVLKKIGPALIAVALMLSAVSARADLQVFNDAASWSARSIVNGTVNFNGIAPTGSYVNLGKDFTIGGIVFHADTYGTYVVDSAFNPSLYTNWGTGGGILQVGANSTLTMTIPSSSAFSLQLMTFEPFGATFTISVYNGNTLLATYQVFSANYPAPTFFGIGSPDEQMFNKIVITSTGAYQLFDNIAYGIDPPPTNETLVPEPASFLLLGTGLTGLGYLARKRVRQ
ncbi:MAG TPA: PEP-CTERM sorting domain-containing protein [Terriglobales bacterium]|nr:PEP-CTERM sorting domain-containing protein [Terriglobales bacterium]